MSDRVTQPGPATGIRERAIAFLMPRLPLVRYVGLHRGFLKQSGWAASARANAPVDRDGRPLPWYTYPAISFLEARVPSGVTVFEYGSGSSTKWWAARSTTVTAVEDDHAWFERVRTDLPANVDLRFAPLASEEYVGGAAHGGPYDVVIIDGSERNRCAPPAVAGLKDDGVLVWDNADWTHMFAEGIDVLEQAGFRRIDFTGPGPLNGYAWTTSVFYRPGRNRLGI